MPNRWPHLTGDLDFLPALGDRLEALAAARRQTFNVTSGGRTRAEQQVLWNNRASNPFPVARPGTSRHETRRAADVYVGGQPIQNVISGDMLRRFGLSPLAGDEVHVELASGGTPVRTPHIKRTPVTRWLGDIQRIAVPIGVPAPLMLGLIEVESAGNPNAVSSARAFGLTQFIPSTARSYGVKPGNTDSQIRGSARYLVALGVKNNPREALAKYNGGPGNPQYGYADTVLAAARKYEQMGAGSGSVPGGTGRVRPGGADTGGGTAGLDNMFASYYGAQSGEGETTPVIFGIPGTPSIPGIPLPSIPNPLGLWDDAKGAVEAPVDFLKFLMWVLNPQHIVQAVNVLIGLPLIILGIIISNDAARDAAGRVADVGVTAVTKGKAGNAGRRTTTLKQRGSKPFANAHVVRKQGREKAAKRAAERERDDKYGDIPF